MQLTGTVWMGGKGRLLVFPDRVEMHSGSKRNPQRETLRYIDAVNVYMQRPFFFTKFLVRSRHVAGAVGFGRVDDKDQAREARDLIERLISERREGSSLARS